MSRPKPLQGIRVLDFTWVRAGPWATRWLGVLGAEVIKIEWPESLDMLRRIHHTTPPDIEPGPNSQGLIADMHVNKLGITLDVRSPRGKELVRSLISVSDIVVENFSSRVMRSWGIGYEDMKELKADVIYLSMAGLGQTGRDHSYTTFGQSAQALSGVTHLSGLPGEPPAGWGWSYLDDSGGLYGAMSALTALRHRDVTGRGQHVDLAQMAVGITLTGSAFLDHTANGRPSRREGFPPGNRTVWPGAPPLHNYRGPITAPHNAYRTRGGGYNDWCVIACFSDQEWRALVGLMGSPEWAADARFASVESRLQHQEGMDRGIEAWTLTLDKYELTARCQEAGVRAMPVQSSEDRVENDPQLRARGMYVELEHPLLGRREVQNAPFELSETPVKPSAPAPLIGQHTREVMEGLLGLDREEVLAGYRDGTFWPVEMGRYEYIEEALA